MVSILFEFHPSAASALDGKAADILACVQEVHVPLKGRGTAGWWSPEDAPIITDKDIVGDPVLRLTDVNGDNAVIFITSGGSSFGLVGEAVDRLQNLIDSVLKNRWVQKCISSSFIENTFFEWTRNYLRVREAVAFSAFFIERCKSSVLILTATAPVQHLAVEDTFEFGSTKIRPLGASYFEDLRRQILEKAPGSQDNVNDFIEQVRKKMANCSAVEFQIQAEPNYAQDAALQRAADAVGLLRFFCLASVTSTLMSPVTLLGALAVPEAHVFTTSPVGGFQYRTGGALGTDDIEFWRISKADWASFRSEGLETVGDLLDVDILSDFGRDVRSSILGFSRALTFAEMSDRLVFAFSAIEGLMLRSASEPIQQNVAERIAFSTTSSPVQRSEIIENFRKSYKMRSQYVHHRLTATDVTVLDRSFENIRAALAQAVVNIKNFKTKDEYLSAIDKVKLGF